MFYRLYSMSMWEYFYSAGVAGILRECIFFAGIPSHPALKIFNPTPSRSRGIPAGPTGLPQCGTPFWGSNSYFIINHSFNWNNVNFLTWNDSDSFSILYSNDIKSNKKMFRVKSFWIQLKFFTRNTRKLHNWKWCD